MNRKVFSAGEVCTIKASEFVLQDEFMCIIRLYEDYGLKLPAARTIKVSIFFETEPLSSLRGAGLLLYNRKMMHP